jgi:hypothetical protein
MHPLIEQRDIKKMSNDKISETMSELRKKKTMVMRSSQNPLVLQQIDDLIATYQLELHERSAKRIAKDKEKGTEHDDLINIE